MKVSRHHSSRFLFPILCVYFEIAVAVLSNESLVSCPRINPYKYDPNRHKETYSVGILPLRGVDAAFAEWNKTFVEYLSATAGQNFDRPIRFELKPVPFATLYEDALKMDFLFLNPSAYSCVESEYGASSLVSLINRRKVGGKIYDLTMFGGVIMTRFDNDKVNSLEDLKDKKIAAASISGLGSGQMQFREMQNAGLSHITSPKQLIFTSNQGKVVNGVLDGEFDVGFVRTDQIERTKDKDGNLVNASLFKTIEPQPGLEIDGVPFPFESSTPLYPEWNLAVRPHVPNEVSAEVQYALLALADHAKVGAAIAQCQIDNNGTLCSNDKIRQEYDFQVRCDTSKDVAEIAYDAMTNGKYAGWRTTLSYMELRSMQQATGFISLDQEQNIWQCVRTKGIYDAITCPEGEHKKSMEDVETGCSDAGLVCKEGYLCICSPCERPFVCTHGSAAIAGRCFSYIYIMLTMMVPLGIVVVFGVRCYVRHKRKQADSVWIVKSNELSFSEPPEVIGQGTFGLVVLAEYRGTQVAVKRVLPPVGKSIVRRSMKHTSFKDPGKTESSGVLDCVTSNCIDSTSKTKMTTKDVESQTEDVDENDLTIPSLNDDHSLNPLTEDNTTSSTSSFLLSWVSNNGKRSEVTKNEYVRLKSDFIREMRHLSKLRHPCITTLMGAVITKQDEPMLVMEYMQHGTLYDLLHNETMVIEGQIVFPILLDIAQGLRFLHAAQPPVVHGDLKAQNILVDSKFRAKVTDFGFSQKRKVGISGTPYWMAPELLRHETTNTTKSDMYSFGIILYEIYSRKEPYEGEDMHQVLRQVCDHRVNKRPPVPESCPPKAAALMSECLFSLPSARPSAEILDLRLKTMEVSNIEPITSKNHSYKQDNNVGGSDLRNSRVLYDVFPRHIARALAAGRKVEPETHEMVSIFFSDIVGFTEIASKASPIKVSSLLDRLYQALDNLATKHGVFKIETVGDAYMGVTNLGGDQSKDHVKRIAKFAVDAVKASSNILIDLDDPDQGHVQLRAGFHSGPVVSNVVGSLNPKYGIFGDTVNTASRMESTSAVGRVHCSDRSANILKKQAPQMGLSLRGNISVKGKGFMTTYWVTEGKLDTKQRHRSSVDLCIYRLD